MNFDETKEKLNIEVQALMFEGDLKDLKKIEAAWQGLYAQLFVQLWSMIAGQTYREFHTRTTRLKWTLMKRREIQVSP